MDRRKFIESMTALGCISVLQGPMATPLFAAAPAKQAFSGRRKYDENLIVLISDMHCNPSGYHPEKLRRVVSDILKMRPLPANVIGFGDLAYLTGRQDEYACVKGLLDPLEEAGIKLTLGMGNHDRRENFAAVFPDKAAKTLLPGRMVFKVETPRADFIMLDSLNQGEDESTWITKGTMDVEQMELLSKLLSESKKPVFVGAHHPIHEIGVKEILCKSLSCCGFIHGHDHIWRPGWLHQGFENAYILRTLCLPSTGHWGDIGYTVFRIGETKATAELHEYEYFFPGDNPAESPAQREMICEDNKGATCTFTLKR